MSQQQDLRCSPAELLDKVCAVVGVEHAFLDSERALQLTGMARPIVVAAPANETETAAVLTVARENRMAVTAEGAGSQIAIGNRLRTVDLLVSSARMNQVLAYSPSDLVVTVEPGVTLRQLRERLAKDNQMLPVDPLCRQDATLGGVLASGLSGPLRTGYGTLRDMTIGLHVVYPSGQIVHTGGKVVKNVAGYDMTKLFIGSMGTLAYVTEITFKLRPQPQYAELCLIAGNLQSLTAIAARILDSNLLPSRLEVIRGQRWDNAHAWILAVECQENEQAAAFQTNALQNLAQAHGLNVDVVRGQFATEHFWTTYQQVFLDLSTTVRVSAAPAGILQVCGGLYEAAVSAGLDCAVSVGSLSGVAHIGLSSGCENDGVVAKWLEAARTAVGAMGAVVVERTTLALQQSLDAFGPPRGDFALMKGIKQTIDPLGLMNPGKFVGGM